ncbi:hypothetical protein GCM10010106_25790 [Thermopolyspora flexuosa]|jgi:hypothetical protein|uniref:hypothetical protein n=1 Tax=Thermopolyspora flexuosa TaxID=103836 RepID=UPI001150B63D|nr:hypothetical protein [Thermopolyspora flexuosa]GGM78087.1 hypothetical protein GCM10010106_25790 [Thermopolyspora flexuosa]
MTTIIERAITDYEHKRFVAEFHAAVRRTMADPAAGEEYRAEAAILDPAGDGLELEDFSEPIPQAPRKGRDANGTGVTSGSQTTANR